MSLDSKVQIKKQIMKEIEEWVNFYGIVGRMSDYTAVTYHEKNDITLSIFEALNAGIAFDPEIPDTVDTEDEHYNSNIIQE